MISMCCTHCCFVVGRVGCITIAAVEQKRHTQDSQGRILALALRFQSSKLSYSFLVGSSKGGRYKPSVNLITASHTIHSMRGGST